MGEEVVVRHFEPTEIRQALTILCLTGGSERAAERCAEQGIPVAGRTLRRWRESDHRELFLEIASSLQPEIEKAVVASTLDYLQRSEELKGDLLGLLKEQIDAKEVKDPAKAAQHLSVSQGIGIDTVLKVQGRPTQLIQHSSVDDSVATLKRLGIVVDGEAEEISEAEVVEEEKPEGPAGVAIAPESSSQTQDATPAGTPPTT